MSELGNGSKITISEERLKLILADFKLELVKELANYASVVTVTAIDARLKMLELWQAQSQGVAQTKRAVSDRFLAWAALLVAAIGGLVYLVSLLVHHQHG